MSTFTKETALEQYQDIYRAEFREFHSRVIDCIGLLRWLEIIEQAKRDGRDVGKYFSYLIQREMSQYNQLKKK